MWRCVLVDRLDDSRGFCLDILGYKQRAKLDKGTPRLTVATATRVRSPWTRDSTANAIKAGRFHMPGFDVCMTAQVRPRQAQRLGLGKCDGSPAAGLLDDGQGQYRFQELAEAVRDGWRAVNRGREEAAGRCILYGA